MSNEPSDQDYEHCGGCACLSECGCLCSDCRGAVKTMVEVGHGEGCGCTAGTESLTAKLRGLELQVSELRKLQGHWSTVELALKAQEEMRLQNDQLRSEVHSLKADHNTLGLQVSELKSALHKIACAECSVHDKDCERIKYHTSYCACDARVAGNAVGVVPCPAMTEKPNHATDSGVALDGSKNVSEGVCLAVACKEPLNPAPCCFCATHHPKCWLGGDAATHVAKPDSEPSKCRSHDYSDRFGGERICELCGDIEKREEGNSV